MKRRWRGYWQILGDNGKAWSRRTRGPDTRSSPRQESKTVNTDPLIKLSEPKGRWDLTAGNMDAIDVEEKGFT